MENEQLIRNEENNSHTQANNKYSRFRSKKPFKYPYKQITVKIFIEQPEDLKLTKTLSPALGTRKNKKE